MKKLIAFLMVAGLMTFGVSNLVVAQEEQAQTEVTEQTVAPEETPAIAEAVEEVVTLLYRPEKNSCRPRYKE